MPLHVSSTCAHQQEVKIALHSLWYHHTSRCDDTRGYGCMENDMFSHKNVNIIDISFFDVLPTVYLSN